MEFLVCYWWIWILEWENGVLLLIDVGDVEFGLLFFFVILLVFYDWWFCWRLDFICWELVYVYWVGWFIWYFVIIFIDGLERRWDWRFKLNLGSFFEWWVYLLVWILVWVIWEFCCIFFFRLMVLFWWEVCEGGFFYRVLKMIWYVIFILLDCLC